jgi:hypothetical protein
LPSAKLQVLGKDLIFYIFLFFIFLKNLCRVPPSLALGKEGIFLKIKNSFAEWWALALGKIFFFYFGPQIFSMALLLNLRLHVHIWYIFVAFCYI